LWNIVIFMGIGQAVCRPVVVLAIVLSLLLSGCARTSQSELDKAKAAGASEEAARQSASAQQDAQAKLAAEIQKLKAQLDAKTATVTPSTVTASVSVPVAPQGTSCGSNVSAGPNTTCPFALNVAAEYLTEGGGTISIVVYSPVTGLDYTMSCVAGVPSICRGGNNAVVYIR
jgi:Flp pilus assembly protein TadG